MKGKGIPVALALAALLGSLLLWQAQVPAEPAPPPLPTASPTPAPTPTPDPYSNEKATVDASRLTEGLVSVLYTGAEGKRVKVRITKAEGRAYSYDLNSSGRPETFALTQGAGTYTLEVLEHLRENRYEPVHTISLEVALTDERAPFLFSSQFVYYTPDSKTVGLARELAGELDKDSEKTAVLFDYVVDHLSYDKEKTEQVAPGYLPDLDQTLAEGKGICFDYAALLCAMLRSQGVPCKLVMGDAGNLYHAWVEVWCEEPGQIGESIPIQGGDWTLLDPTFVSSSGRSPEIMAFVTQRENYSPTSYY